MDLCESQLQQSFNLPNSSFKAVASHRIKTVDATQVHSDFVEPLQDRLNLSAVVISTDHLISGPKQESAKILATAVGTQTDLVAEQYDGSLISQSHRRPSIDSQSSDVASMISFLVDQPASTLLPSSTPFATTASLLMEEPISAVTRR